MRSRINRIFGFCSGNLLGEIIARQCHTNGKNTIINPINYSVIAHWLVIPRLTRNPPDKSSLTISGLRVKPAMTEYYYINLYMKKYSIILITLLFFSFSSLKAADYTQGEWKISVDLTGKVNIYHSDVLLISNSQCSFKIGSVSYSQDQLSDIAISEHSNADTFGSGKRIEITSKTSDNHTVTHNYYLYDGYILTDFTVEGDAFETNYMAPVKTSTAVAFLPATNNRTLRVPFDNDKFVPYLSNSFDKEKERTTKSYEVSAIYNINSNEGLVVGSIEHILWKTGVETISAPGNSLNSLEVYGGVTVSTGKNNELIDKVPHGAVKGTSVKSPKIFIGYFKDWRVGMETYADVNTLFRPKLPWNDAKPFLWNSWGAIQSNLSYLKTRQVSDWVANNLQSNNFQNADGKIYINLDSYWDNLSGETKYVPAYCDNNQQVAGIYWAPFADWGKDGDRNVEGSGYQYKDLYLYADGKTQDIDGAWALDPTHPGTKKRIDYFLKRFKNEGYKYIKLDFMGHGAVEADSHYNPEVYTGIQAYNEGMQYILDVLDNSMFINLSIAPLFPSNYSHSRRIACDAYSSLSDARYTLNSLTYGWWLDHAYSYNDADHVVLFGVSDGANKIRVTSSVITGIFTIGDDFSAEGKEDAKKRALKFLTNKDINKIAHQTKAFRPVKSSTSANEAATMFYSVVGDTTYVAVFNYGFLSANNVINFADLGLTVGTTYTVRELWSGDQTTQSDSWTESVAGSNVKVFKIFTGEEKEDEGDPNANQPTNWTAVDKPLSIGNLPTPEAGIMIWGDYNNDGQLDAFIVAGKSDADAVVGLYKNEGDSTFTSINLGADFSPLSRASAVFIDYDNDGNLDLLVLGEKDGDKSCTLYRNTGLPDYTFAKVDDTPFPPVSLENNNHNPRVVHAFDYNNDGWMDLIITGHSGSTSWNEQNRIVALFKNNRGVFEYQETPVAGSGFRAVNGGSVNIGDANNDGYPDILISGYLDGTGGVTDLYLNNKRGGFTRASQPTFTGHQEGETFFVDVNNDGWLDIVEIGRDLSNNWNGFSNLYINNKNGSFARKLNPFPGGQAVVSVGDVNNDGFTDIFAMGYQTGAKFIYNKGNGVFKSVDFPHAVRGGFNNLVDFNGDNTLDFGLFGWSDNDNALFHGFYVNDKGDDIAVNQAPDAPTGLEVVWENNKYKLSWNPATDDHTPQSALRYNISIDYKDGTSYTYVPADTITGKVKVNGLQAFITTTSIELNLPEGDYDFKVQAIDQANVGSLFASVITEEIPETPTGINNRPAVGDVMVYALGKSVTIVNNASVSVEYSLISVSGQKLQGGTCNAGSVVSSSVLMPGVYLVKLRQDNAVETVKVIVY
jgi:alpha-galactosidase